MTHVFAPDAVLFGNPFNCFDATNISPIGVNLYAKTTNFDNPGTWLTTWCN